MDTTAIEREVLAIVHGLVQEAGSARALRAVAPGAALERDLGLGSLERVELLLRLGDAFRVELPEAAAAELQTVRDLVEAIGRAGDGSGAPVAGAAAPALVPAQAVARAEAAADPPQTAGTLDELLRRRAAETPDLPHVELREEDGTVRTITYAGLERAAAAMAACLRERGLPRGAPVALMLPTSAAFFQSFFATLLAGGVPLPLYPPHRLDQIEEYAARQAAILKNAEARLLITSARTGALAAILEARVPSLAAVETPDSLHGPRGSEVGAAMTLAPDDLALLQYTSGSTGVPKGVMLSHANLLANVRAIAAGLALTPADVVVSWLPLYHDMGLIGTWLGSLHAGTVAHISSPLSFLTRPQRWLWAIHEHRATVSAAPNFAYDLCARKIPERALAGLDLHSWRIALNGSEPISPESLELFCRRFEPYGFRSGAMFPAYGLAENSVALTFPPPGRGARIDLVERVRLERDAVAAPAGAAAAPGSALRFVGVGAPVQGSEVRVMGPDGAPLGERGVGRILFRGTSASPGYYRNPEATAELVRPDGWRESGDLGYQADGELFVTGRSKDLIIKAGRNLVPQEVEELAGAVEGVRQGSVVAFAAPGTAGTEALVVVAETRAAGREERERIGGQVGERIVAALGVAPDEVVLVGAGVVPKTSSGKIRRSECCRAWQAGEYRVARAPARWRTRARAVAERAGLQVRRGARRAAEAVYGAYVMTLLFGAMLPLSLLLRLARPSRRASALVRGASRAVLALAGLAPRVSGGERLAGAGPRVIVTNHTSYLDVIVLLAVLPGEPRFVAKSELLEHWLFGPILARTGGLPVRRLDARASLEDAARIEARLAAGDTVVYYPEGTFTPATGLRPFKLGAFAAAVAAGAEVLPVVHRGVREVLRDLTWLPRWGPVEVRVGAAMRPAGRGWSEAVRLRDRCRAWIAAECGEPVLDLVRAGVPLEE